MASCLMRCNNRCALLVKESSGLLAEGEFRTRSVQEEHSLKKLRPKHVVLLEAFA